MYLIVLTIAVFAGCQTVSVAERPTPVRCPCTLNINPVCSTNNVTYDNRCQLECAKRTDRRVRFACNGTCPCTCPCTADYKPVCGNDGKTYSNECELRCARLIYVNKFLRVRCNKECPC